MAEIGKIVVPVELEATESAKELIKSIVAGILLDDLNKENGGDIRAFIRDEVRKALAEEVSRIRNGMIRERQ